MTQSAIPLLSEPGQTGVGPTAGFDIIVMRTFWAALLFVAVFMASCTKSGIPFQSGGKLSVAEQQNIAAIHPLYARWHPNYSAFWVQHGVAQHVCLSTDGGSIVWPYDVFVFDGDGRVVEANIIDAPSGAEPKSLPSISPLRVEFAGGALHDQSAIVGLRYLHDEGHQKFCDQAKQKQRMRDVFDAWRRSGSTNFDTLEQMMKSAETNSTK
jgi:hypothetical protein